MQVSTNIRFKKAINSILNQNNHFPFRVAVINIHQKFNIDSCKSKSFEIFNQYLQGEVTGEHDEEINKMLSNLNPRRAIFNFMLKLKDIPEEQLQEKYPEGIKRQQLENWIEGKYEDN